MSYKVLQLSPRASTRFTPKGVTAQNRTVRYLVLPVNVELLQPGFESDWDLNQADEGGTTWSAFSGLALAVALSACFWVGLAWAVEHVWR